MKYSEKSSGLVQGNKAFRDKRYAEAVAFYAQAVAVNPGLLSSLALNLTVAHTRLNKEKSQTQVGKIAVIGRAGDPELFARITKLPQLHRNKGRAVELIICGADQQEEAIIHWLDVTMLHRISVSDADSFMSDAIAFVAAHPCEQVHLLRPKNTEMIMGLLYKLIWGAQLLIDLPGRDSENIAELIGWLDFAVDGITMPCVDGPTNLLGVPVCQDDALDGSVFCNKQPSGPDIVSALKTGKVLESDLPDDLKLPFEEFDPIYYAVNYGFEGKSKRQLFNHYNRLGWREHKNPNRGFSTEYYLRKNKDINNAGINPYVHYVNHGRREGRAGISVSTYLQLKYVRPLVSAVVPNYNHANYLIERLRSIDEQSYSNIEIIVLDDCSSDNSRDVIEAFQSRRGRTIRRVYNDANSGGVFYQWQKGFQIARGELIWICESDDFCELNFIEKLIDSFADPSVMIAFGAIQFADKEGTPVSGLDGYRERAEPGIWSKRTKRSAAEWFSNGFSVSNLIPNVGGCLIRNQHIPDSVWDEARSYKICGDWYLYLELAHGGQMVFEPEAITYFRQHGANTSVSGFVRAPYYIEHEKIAQAVWQHWAPRREQLLRFAENIKFQFKHFNAVDSIGALDQYFSVQRIESSAARKPHVLVAFLGFSLGGGEIVPITLANELARQGVKVSALVLEYQEQNAGVRRMLDPSVPLYFASEVEDEGVPQFLQRIGVDLVHSHIIGIEKFFFVRNRESLEIPYLVTLHGSYEVTPTKDDDMKVIIENVNHWFYLADKNIAHLQDANGPRGSISKIRNGYPMDTRPFPLSRSDLGIPDDAFVFGVASRAIKDKGWAEAAEALRLAQKDSKKKLHIIFAGDGDFFQEVSEHYKGDDSLKFVGYQECIHGLYRMCDCAMLPTRFMGESFPLTLIQAMQVGRPIISTDIGEIKSMLVDGSEEAGILVPFTKDTEEYVAKLAAAMCSIQEVSLYSRFAGGSATLGRKYDISVIAAEYVSFYSCFC